MNMKPLFLLISFGCFFIMEAHSQRFNPSDTVRYELLKDDVENYKFFTAGISFAELDLSLTNLSVYGLGVFAQGELTPNFFLMADYRFSIVERVLHPFDFDAQTPGFSSIYGDSRSNRARVEGTYYFSNKTEKGVVPVFLKSTQELAGKGDGSMETVKYYASVDGNINTRLGIRLGLDRGVSAYSMNSADRISAIRSDGVTTSFDVSGGMEGSSYMDYTVLRIGGARTKFSNVHINTDKFGYRHHSHMRYFYFDVLIALRQEIEDVYATRTDIIESDEFSGLITTPYYERMNLQDANDFRNLGLAVGYRTPSIAMGGEQTFELGYYPGIQGVNGLYFQFGWRFAFAAEKKMKNVPAFGASSN